MDYDSFCAICTVVCACTITICVTIYRVIRKGNNFMTQAEKARAYDEAIKRAKEINSEQKAQPFDVMLKVFPELKKDSEDEKIRKALIEMFISIGKRDFRDIPTKKIIAWLKKQSEQKPYGQRAECLDCQFNYAGECKGSCAMKRIEQKPAEWSEEDERKYEDIRGCIYHCCVSTEAKHLCNWLETQLSK